MTKLESFIEEQENCCWSISTAMFVCIMLSFQSESQGCCDCDWIFLFFLQVEVAK